MTLIEKIKKADLKYYYLTVLLFSSLIFLARIYEPSLYGDGAKYALIAKNMVKTGNFLVPSLGFEDYFKKPPFFFWMIALFFKLFGFSEFSARLPSAVFGIADALLIFYLAKGITKDKLISLFSAIVFVLNFEVIRITTTVRFDSFVLFVNLLTIALLYRINVTKGVITALVLSAGALTKGPMAYIGIVSIMIYRLLRGELKEVSALTVISIFSLLPFTLYALFMYHHYPVFFREFFENQIVGRISGTLKEGTHRPFFFYERIIIKHFWPWNLALFYLLILSLKRKSNEIKKLFLFPNQQLFNILLIMFLLIFIPLHFVSLKFTRYSYYFYPFLSLIVATVIVRKKILKPALTFVTSAFLIYIYLSTACPCSFHKDKLKDLRPLVEVGLENFKKLGIDRKIKRDYIYALLFYFDNVTLKQTEYVVTNNCSKGTVIKFRKFCIIRSGVKQ